MLLLLQRVSSSRSQEIIWFQLGMLRDANIPIICGVGHKNSGRGFNADDADQICLGSDPRLSAFIRG